MSTREQFKLSTAERRKRTFSEDFKRQRVREFELKQTTITEVGKAYQVRQCNVWKWMVKYGSSYKKGVRLIVEMESESKKLIELQAKIAELERIIGQKQLTIDFQAKIIDLAEQAYKLDIKKKFETTPSSTSGKTDKS